MKIKAMFSIIPIGVGVSLSRYVAACEQVVSARGLKSALHAHGTNLEGEWDEVLGTIRDCVEKVHELGAPRVSTWVKLSTRTDREQTMDDMVRSVRRKLDRG